MKLKALIIDDEPLAHEVIKSYARDIPFLDIVGSCYLATEALTTLNSLEVDLLFLDIQMPKIKGNEFLKTLKNKPFVIMTTAYEEYALESYELDVSDYLLKPFRFDRFLKAINKVYDQCKMNYSVSEVKQEDQENSASTSSEKLLIKVDKRHIQLNSHQIYFLEAYGNYVKIWEQDQSHLTPRTLSSFEEQLNSKNFLRVHKSYIVNKDHIKFLEGNRLMLTNKQEIPVGKSYKQQMMDMLQ